MPAKYRVDSTEAMRPAVWQDDDIQHILVSSCVLSRQFKAIRISSYCAEDDYNFLGPMAFEQQKIYE